jgi:hypothetical protein
MIPDPAQSRALTSGVMAAICLHGAISLAAWGKTK